MCGRFGVNLAADQLVEQVREALSDPLMPVDGRPVAPATNISPTCTISAVVKRRLTRARWGFTPQWKHNPSVVLFNARSETAHTKPSFADAVASRRCLVPMTCWYEWSNKQPYRVRPAAGDPLIFAAGLWSPAPAGLEVTIMTTSSNGSSLEWLHDRMPVILARDALPTWLDAPSEQALALTRPARVDRVVETFVTDPFDPARRAASPTLF